MAPKTPRERKRDERFRKRREGYVLKQAWVREADWPRVRKYLKRLRKHRG